MTMTQKIEPLMEEAANFATPDCMLVANRYDDQCGMVEEEFYVLGVFEKNDRESVGESIIAFCRNQGFPVDCADAKVIDDGHTELLFNADKNDGCIGIRFSVVENKYPVCIGSTGYSS